MENPREWMQLGVQPGCLKASMDPLIKLFGQTIGVMSSHTVAGAYAEVLKPTSASTPWDVAPLSTLVCLFFYIHTLFSYYCHFLNEFMAFLNGYSQGNDTKSLYLVLVNWRIWPVRISAGSSDSLSSILSLPSLLVVPTCMLNRMYD